MKLQAPNFLARNFAPRGRKFSLSLRAGLYPYLFGRTPSPRRNQREIGAKGCSPAASPNVHFRPTDERRCKRLWISVVFRKRDGVQQKRCGTRPALRERVGVRGNA